MLTNATQSPLSPITAAAGLGRGKTIGKEDFLQLLVAQLKHQDPMQPQDPTEFTAQLAQFTSLEQLFAISKGIEQLSAGNAEMERVGALGMIGREVVTESGRFRLGTDGATLGWQLDQAASEVELQILDASGRVVATSRPAEMGSGSHFLRWEGVDALGQTLPPGEYSLGVRAIGADGAEIAGRPLVKAIVSGIDLDPLGTRLVTGSGEFLLSQVRSVSDF